MKKNLVTAAATAGLIFTAFGASASAQENTYTVQPGDSLWKIAKLNNVSIDNLKALNKLSSDQLYVNQKLSLHYTYTIKSGDSLWKIARAYGTTVSELKSTNGLTADLIQIGQQIKVPASNVTVSAPAPAPASVPTANNVTSYVIQKGDSLYSIGARYHLTISELKSMNQLTSNKIIAGNILKLRSDRANAAVQPAEKPAAQQTAPAASQPAAQPTALAAAKPATQPAAPAASQPAAQQAAPAAAKPATQQTAPAASQPAAQQAAPAAAKPAAQPAAPQVAQKPAATATASVQGIIDEARKYIGTPYSWGGNTPAGFDCSGFVKYVFNKSGVSLPRTTETQWSATTPVGSPSVGDLVFFQTYKVGPSHVGIYLGNNKFISAASSGVTISDMTSSYWKTRYLGARRAF